MEFKRGNFLEKAKNKINGRVLRTAESLRRLVFVSYDVARRKEETQIQNIVRHEGDLNFHIWQVHTYAGHIFERRAAGRSMDVHDYDEKEGKLKWVRNYVYDFYQVLDDYVKFKSQLDGNAQATTNTLLYDFDVSVFEQAGFKDDQIKILEEERQTYIDEALNATAVSRRAMPRRLDVAAILREMGQPVEFETEDQFIARGGEEHSLYMQG